MIEIIENIKSINNEDTIKIKNDKSIYSENFYFEDIYSSSRVNRFIKSVERMIRNSDEYKEYIGYLHSSSNFFNKDNVLSNITQDVAEIEIHHYPISLYDLVDIILTKNISIKQKVTSFDISREIMELHAKNMVGLIPLCTTNHELAHANILGISKDQIFGDYNKFVKENEKYIRKDLLFKIERLNNGTVTLKFDELINNDGN